MFSVSASLEGDEKLRAQLRQLTEAVRGKMALKAVEAGAAVVVLRAQQNVRSVFNNRSGNLRNSIRIVRSEQTQNGAFAEVAPGVVYARIQEFGGTVRPVRAKVLRFQINGHWVSAKQVRIPARPYLRPAVEENQGEIVRTMAEELFK